MTFPPAFPFLSLASANPTSQDPAHRPRINSRDRKSANHNSLVLHCDYISSLAFGLHALVYHCAYFVIYISCLRIIIIEPIVTTMKATCDLKLKMATKQILKGRVERDHLLQEEMQSLLCRLKDLVPNMPRNKKLSKLEIIQYVIDYIMDLQIALETHPAATKPTTNVMISSSQNRQPLGVLSPAINTCAAQEVCTVCFLVELLRLYYKNISILKYFTLNVYLNVTV